MIKSSQRTLFLLQQKWWPALRGVPLANYINGEWVQGNGTTALEVADPNVGSILSFAGGEKIHPFTKVSEVNSAVEGAKEAASKWQHQFSREARRQAVAALGAELRAELSKLALFTALNAGVPHPAAKITTALAAQRCESAAATSAEEKFGNSASTYPSAAAVSCIATGPSFPLEDFVEKALEAVVGQQQSVLWFPSPLAPLSALHLTTIIRKLEGSKLIPRGLFNVVFLSSTRDPLLPQWFQHKDLNHFRWAPVASHQEHAASLQFFNITDSHRGGVGTSPTSTKQFESALYPINQVICDAEGFSNPAASDAIIHKLIYMIQNRGRFGVESIPKVVYVPRAHAIEFAVALANAVSKLPLGHALDPTTVVGPLIAGSQGDVFHEVLKESCDRFGVDVVAGGFSPSFAYAGCYLSPTVAFVENIDAPILKLRGPPLSFSIVPYDDAGDRIPTLTKPSPTVVGDWRVELSDSSKTIRCGTTSPPSLRRAAEVSEEESDAFWSYLTSSDRDSSFSKQCRQISRKIPNEGIPAAAT
jgi:hypothetical protein